MNLNINDKYVLMRDIYFYQTYKATRVIFRILLHNGVKITIFVSIFFFLILYQTVFI